MNERFLIAFALLAAGCSQKPVLSIPDVPERLGRAWDPELKANMPAKGYSVRFLGRDLVVSRVRMAWRIYAPDGLKLGDKEFKGRVVIDHQVVVGRDDSGPWYRVVDEGVEGPKGTSLAPGKGRVSTLAARFESGASKAEDLATPVSKLAPQGGRLELIAPGDLPESVRFLTIR